MEIAVTFYKLQAAQSPDWREVTGILSETGGGGRKLYCEFKFDIDKSEHFLYLHVSNFFVSIYATRISPRLKI